MLGGVGLRCVECYGEGSGELIRINDLWNYTDMLVLLLKHFGWVAILWTASWPTRIEDLKVAEWTEIWVTHVNAA